MNGTRDLDGQPAAFIATTVPSSIMETWMTWKHDQQYGSTQGGVHSPRVTVLPRII